MEEHDLISIWKQEEDVAHIHGWDFSHLDGRYTEETDLPWDYRRIILNHLKPEMKLLDVDTGAIWSRTSNKPNHPSHQNMARMILLAD